MTTNSEATPSGETRDISKVNALKNILHESIKIDADFFRKVAELEIEYEKKHNQLFKKRSHIISGDHKPTPEESKWKYESLVVNNEFAKMCINEKNGIEKVGIENFWLTAMRNAANLDPMIFTNDIPVLEFLYDVTCNVLPVSNPGFVLNFHFKNNPYFDNTVLTKTYYLSFEIDEKNPLSYSGPEIVGHEGCTINWKPGKDITKKTVKKTQKHKESKVKRVLTKTIEADSFFNFFSMEKTMLDDVGEDEFIECDFAMGQFFRELFIPKAVLFYTGEYVDDEDGQFDSSDEDSDESDDDEDSVDEDDDEPIDEKDLLKFKGFMKK